MAPTGIRARFYWLAKPRRPLTQVFAIELPGCCHSQHVTPLLAGDLSATLVPNQLFEDCIFGARYLEFYTAVGVDFPDSLLGSRQLARVAGVLPQWKDVDLEARSEAE